MTRLWIAVATLVLASQPAAWGETIHCRTPDGTLVFTDTAMRVPANCEPLEKPAAGGTLSIVPGSRSEPAEPSPDAASQASESAPLPESTGVPASQAPDQLFRLWQARVDELVADYRETLRQRYHATLLRDKRAAMDRLEQLKDRKQIVLKELAESPLSSSQRAQLRSDLGEVPSP